MGFFSGISKALRKVVKSVTKPVGGLLGADAAQQVIAPPPPPAAAQVDIPKQENVEGDDEAQTESDKKRSRASGKKSLSVARSSGGGINL